MNWDLWSKTTVQRFARASWNKEDIEIETEDAESTFN